MIIYQLDHEYQNNTVFIIHFKLNEHRHSPITNGYRSDWTSQSKPKYNCGAISLFVEKEVAPNSEVYCLLMPLRFELWKDVKVGDELDAMEGFKKVGTAKVLGIIREE